jgi:flavin reductase (DIM6/NTAB) family NADH-FMN oxidoreductase RutF
MEDANDPRRLRDAFGCFGTGVTVVSAFGPERRPVGITANSFTSVSLEPPLVLFCLARSSRRLPAFEAAERYAVNVLHAGQEGLSAAFSSGAAEPAADWREAAGAPVLADAMATFVCAREAAHDGGDHRIFIGRVLRLSSDPAQDPLLFFQGRYRSVHVPE